MDVTDSNLCVMIGYLEATLDPIPQNRRQAEKQLEAVEANEGYSRLLFALIAKPEIPLHIRQAAAIIFKNFVKRNWRRVEGETGRVSEADRAFVRESIVELMLGSAGPVQRQLSEAVSLIGREDFPDPWRDLLPQLVSKFQTTDFHIMQGVLRTANSIFKRYRHEMRSDKLWIEIKFVLDAFAAPLTELFTAAVDFAENNQQDVDKMQAIYPVLILIAKIFYSLNQQDLPEFFEDNMQVWMSKFLSLLKAEPTSLFDTDSDEEPGLLEQLRSQICNNVAMYAQKYEEEFQAYLPQFVETIWHLLISTGPQAKFDMLVCNSIEFLASVCERPQYKSLFENDNALAQICERVILPSMEFRQSDKELFQDNPDEFIRKDIEGSDVDTRRRAACDFVRSLCKQFEPAVIQIFSTYVQSMLAQYASNPNANWARKDAAVYLVTSLASRGATAKHGVTQASQLVNLEDFFVSHILSDLSVDSGRPVLQADALKYLVTFRQHLRKDLVLKALPLAVDLLKSPSVVVHTYAAHTLERLMTLRNSQVAGSPPLIAATDILPLADPLITSLFHILNTVPESRENEYVMKCVMRSLGLLQDALAGPVSAKILEALVAKMVEMAKNPNKPHFNHYLFESLCLLIRAHSKLGITPFEAALFGPFQDILKQDVTEFIPYTFQVLGLMLAQYDKQIPEAYMALFPFLLVPALWERSGNIPGLVRLLQSFVQVGASQIASGGHLNALLGIFQKLLASKAHDHEGFYLMNSLVEHIDQNHMQPCFKSIFILLFQRLQSSKTTKYVKGFLVFIGLFVIKYGPQSSIDVVESIQGGLFGMLLEKVIIADVQKVAGGLERKICSVGFTKLLTECPAVLLKGQYSNQWVPLLQALVALHELPEEDAPADEHYIDVEDLPGYNSAYSQLAYAAPKETDPTGIADARLYLAKGLEKLSIGYPGSVGPLVKSMAPDAVKFLDSYLTSANVHLA